MGLAGLLNHCTQLLNLIKTDIAFEHNHGKSYEVLLFERRVSPDTKPEVLGQSSHCDIFFHISCPVMLHQLKRNSAWRNEYSKVKTIYNMLHIRSYSANEEICAQRELYMYVLNSQHVCTIHVCAE